MLARLLLALSQARGSPTCAVASEPMAAPKMHADEIDTDVALVRRLLAGQFPQWADLAIDPVVSYGTDHDIYRLGDHLAARLPRIGWATEQAAKEAEWLPKLAPHLPLAVPVQLAMGQPAEGYPFQWSVYEWLPGENANATIDDLDQAAADLAAFVTAFAPDRRGGCTSASAWWSRRTTRGTGRAGPSVDRTTRRPRRRPCHAALMAGVAQRLELGRRGGLGARRPAARQPARRRRPAVGGHRLWGPQRGRSRL